MAKIFKIDNPVFNFLGRVTDLMILNILTLLLCVPVITAGAALTANYYCCLKIRRDEDSGLVGMYFRSFKQNFGQSTILFFIVLLILGVPMYMLLIVGNMEPGTVPVYVKTMLWGALLLALFLTTFVFPLQSRFSNKITNTLKHSMLLAFSNPFRTLAMIIINVLPFVLSIIYYPVLAFVILFGISLPAFCSVLMYNKTFLKMEERANAALGVPEPGSEDEHIFEEHDKSDK